MVEHANQLKDILAAEGIPLIINDRVVKCEFDVFCLESC